MRFRYLGVLGALTVVLAALVAVPASGQTAAQATAKYAVTLVQPPAAGYTGNVSGYERTKPQKGKKYNSQSDASKRYTEYLEQQQEELADDVGAQETIYNYTHAVNGFAAELTEGQAAKLEQSGEVLSVEKAEMLTLDTANTPDFLGLTKPAGQGGLWAKLGGVGGGVGNARAGEDVIIGIVDGGYWPEHPSFSDRRGSQGAGGGQGQNLYPKAPTGWSGTCEAGEEFPANTCNNKVLGAQWFGEGIGPLPSWEYASPRDFGGHGSHTASTAGGNWNITPTGDASGFSPISGMAPYARLAIYKACFVITPGTSGSCNSLDTAAAIDQAVADGVDTLNYSISGTLTAFTNITEVAFLFAAQAGVYVSASAGNSGPTASTVAHPSPWITTTAAGTHNRDGNGTLTIGSTVYNGKSSAANAVTGQLVDSVNAGLPGANAANLALCFGAADGGATLDPAKVAGKIVVCDRGVSARINKSLAVAQAGGIGMVLVNTSPNSVNADLHFVPSIHLPDTNRAAVKAAAATNATATISKGTIVTNAPAPFTAVFSSRGPLLAGGGDILKPDIIAPGQDVLAAVAPPGNNNRLFDLYSGTSMSSPHMAGLGALMKQAHPDWSPAAIKSAFMTTAYQSNDYAPFAWGAGHANPNSAVDPGLVFDNGFDDWIAFLEGQGLATGPGDPLDASDLNSASIAIGDLAGSQTVKRAATSVGSQSETYSVSVQGLAGITVAPSATSFTAAPGSTTNWTVTFTRTSAALNTYTTGFITWTGDKGHVVRMPVVIRPVALAAPAEVTANTSTSTSWQVKTGYVGTLAATMRGLVPATTTPYTVTEDPDANWIGCGDTQGAVAVPVTIPAGTTHYRVGIYEDAITPTDTDLDLFVCQGTTLVGVGGGRRLERRGELPLGGWVRIADRADACTSTGSTRAPHRPLPGRSSGGRSGRPMRATRRSRSRRQDRRRSAGRRPSRRRSAALPQRRATWASFATTTGRASSARPSSA